VLVNLWQQPPAFRWEAFEACVGCSFFTIVCRVCWVPVMLFVLVFYSLILALLLVHSVIEFRLYLQVFDGTILTCVIYCICLTTHHQTCDIYLEVRFSSYLVNLLLILMAVTPCLSVVPS
jgi:hypothetical protein